MSNFKVQVVENVATLSFDAMLTTRSGQIFYGKGRTKQEAHDAAIKAFADAVREKNAKAAEMPIAIDSDTGKWTISTDNPYIAGIGADILNTSLGNDVIQLQTLFAGLIEKAKREGLDGRLIAMANTDFERGFMALEKAINTNKG